MVSVSSGFRMKLQEGGFLLLLMCASSQSLHGQVIKDVSINTALSFFFFYNQLFLLTLAFFFQDIGLQMVDFEGFISSLNNQGFLLKKGSKVYQLQTFGY